MTDDQQAGRLLRHCQLARRASAASPVPHGRARSHLEEDEGGGGEQECVSELSNAGTDSNHPVETGLDEGNEERSESWRGPGDGRTRGRCFCLRQRLHMASN